MGTHSLGGNASIEVTKVTASFASRKPRVEYGSGPNGKLLQFTEPEGHANADGIKNTAEIKFTFKIKNADEKFTFGIKQFIQVVRQSADYVGNKDIDGMMSESFRPGSLWVLDCATTEPEILYDENNVSTGARVQAPQAPFYSDRAAFVKNNTEVELSLIDKPGGVYPMELRNGATDRINYLQSVGRFERFLTVLTAVKPDGSHLPIEAVNWQHRIEGSVAWGEQGRADVSKIVQECTGLGRFPEIPENFLYVDYGLLTNKSLAAADCINQRLNDSLFAVRGLHKRQDFKHPPRTKVSLAVRGFELNQYPTTAAQ